MPAWTTTAINGSQADRAWLEQHGFGWVFDDTVLAGHTPADEAHILRVMRLRGYGRDAVIRADEDDSADLLLMLDGRVELTLIDAAGLEHQAVCDAEGIHLRGGHAQQTTDALRAVARTPTLALQISPTGLIDLIHAIPAVRAFLGDVVMGAFNRDTLLKLISGNPTLRLLSRADQFLLLLGGHLVDHPADSQSVTLYEHGVFGMDAFVVVDGAVELRSPAGDVVAHLGPGDLFGAESLFLEEERPLAAVIPADVAVTVLRISGRHLVDVTDRNVMVARIIMRDIARFHIRVSPYASPPSADDANHVLMVTAHHAGLPLTELTYGMAGSMATAPPVGKPAAPPAASILLVDPDGAQSARRLGLSVRSAAIAGVKVREMVLPPSWPRPLRVAWPVTPTAGLDPAGLEALASACQQGGGGWPAGLQLVILSPPVGGPAEPNPRLLELADVVVLARGASEPPPAELSWRHGERAHRRRGQVWMQVIYMPDDADASPSLWLEAQQCYKSARLWPDPSTMQAFWDRGDLAQVAGPDTRFGRCSARAGRVARGRSVGLALGGGGAFGFVHAGLVQALVEQGFDADCVSGVSFGSLVGALLVGDGPDAVAELRHMGGRLLAAALRGICRRDTFARLVDRRLGGKTLFETEVPLYTVGADVSRVEPFVLPRGTLGEAVQAASSVPGMALPFVFEDRRIVDGGVVDNVPADLVWQSGVDFVLASNVVPIEDRTLRQRIREAARHWIPIWWRYDDAIRSLYHMGAQMGRDRARMADMLFDSNVKGIDVYDFCEAAAIIDHGYKQAVARMDDILHTFEHDTTRRF
jgi:NTE family protein